MYLYRILTLLAVLLTLTTCEALAGPSQPPDGETAAILSHPDRVQIFRMDPEFQSDRSVGIDGSRIVSEGRERRAPFARSLGKLLLDKNTYNGGANACIMQPGVGFRIWSGRRVVSVLLCFRCNQVLLFEGFKPARKPTFGYFYHNRAKLLQLARQALPKDSTIQELKS